MLAASDPKKQVLSKENVSKKISFEKNRLKGLDCCQGSSYIRWQAHRIIKTAAVWAHLENAANHEAILGRQGFRTCSEAFSARRPPPSPTPKDGLVAELLRQSGRAGRRPSKKGDGRGPLEEGGVGGVWVGATR